MNELIKLYKSLEDLEQNKEVKQIKKNIELNLYETLRTNMLQTSAIGDVIGYDNLKTELTRLLELIDIQSKSNH